MALLKENVKIASGQLLKNSIGPGLATAFTAYPYFSGESSAGQAIGETIGGYAGWELGSRLMNRLLPKGTVNTGESFLKKLRPSSLGKGFLRFGGGLAGSLISAGLLGSAMGNYMPVHKRQISYNNIR